MSSTNNGNASPTMSYLFAFDFDHTVVDANSDTVIFKLLKDGVVPQRIRDGLKETNSWTEHMNQVFQQMFDEGVSIEDICACIRGMEPTTGMLQLLTTLISLKTNAHAPEGPSPKVDLLIISDSNTLFITEFLNARVLKPLATNKNSLPSNPFDIITNKASVSVLTDNNQSKKPLQISPCLPQTACNLCPKNLCKGSAIQKYIDAKGPYTSVFYTGDGWNDLCPSLKLNQHDYVFPRIGYNLWKKIENSPEKMGINANIVSWETADTILKVVNQRLGI